MTFPAFVHVPEACEVVVQTKHPTRQLIAEDPLPLDPVYGVPVGQVHAGEDGQVGAVALPLRIANAIPIWPIVVADGVQLFALELTQDPVEL